MSESKMQSPILGEEKHNANDNLTEAFFFFNNCRVGRSFPTRKIRRQPLMPARHRKKKVCSRCGELKTPSTIEYDIILKDEERGFICRDCRHDELERLRQEDFDKYRAETFDKIDAFKDRLENCEKFGTCDILAAHHDVLINDDQRLTTEFLLGLICDPVKAQKYQKPIREEQTFKICPFLSDSNNCEIINPLTPCSVDICPRRKVMS